MMLAALNGFFRERQVLKLLSFFIALTVWSLAGLKETLRSGEEHQFFIPILYTNTPKDVTFKVNPIESIQIVIRNDSGLIENNHPSKFKAVIDMKGFEPGLRDIPISKDQIDSPQDVTVMRVIPSSISVELDALQTKNVPVRPKFSGRLKEGFALEGVALFPDSVRIAGPRSVLEYVRALSTKPINLSEVNHDFDVRIALQPVPDIETPEFDLAAPVLARISVGGEAANLKIENVPVLTVNKKYRTKINPSFANALLRGSKAKIENIDPAEIQLFLDLAGLEPGQYKLLPETDLDPSIELKQVWPIIDVWVLNQLER